LIANYLRRKKDEKEKTKLLHRKNIFDFDAAIIHELSQTLNYKTTARVKGLGH